MSLPDSLPPASGTRARRTHIRPRWWRTGSRWPWFWLTPFSFLFVRMWAIVRAPAGNLGHSFLELYFLDSISCYLQCWISPDVLPLEWA
jgi:hypothetical protein